MGALSADKTFRDGMRWGTCRAGEPANKPMTLENDQTFIPGWTQGVSADC